VRPEIIDSAVADLLVSPDLDSLELAAVPLLLLLFSQPNY
jgi:hypothetical protein